MANQQHLATFSSFSSESLLNFMQLQLTYVCFILWWFLLLFNNCCKHTGYVWKSWREEMKRDKLTMLGEAVKRLWRLEQQKPLQISVMGQTGVGKTSLVNALFGTGFKVSSTRPETLEPQSHTENVGGHQLEFWDLPGLGEARSADERYSDMYREKLLSSHIVIWAIHADSRSFRFDRTALEELINSIPNPDEQVRIMNKIV